MIVDSNKKNAINRIVIGDVGSGKTIVAFLLALNYLKTLPESTVVMLAPTEVLAFQHYQKFLEYKNMWQDDFVSGVRCIFLSNKQSLVESEKLTKKKLELELTNTDIKHRFIIGTHAVLFQTLIVPDLILVDEQHRFGVEQRKSLTQKHNLDDKIQTTPHFVSFTATPIPRTLALTVYKSLQPHFLEPLKERNPIRTNIEIFDNLEKNAVPLIQNELDKQRKVYIICPKIEEKDEEDELWSVAKAEKFFNKFFQGNILTVHGKLTEKKDILAKFKNSWDQNVLIATTVVEVGVDVPEASLVLILNAERFGLSALHQIRGRVGRNSFSDNRCLLITSKEFTRAKRLKYICQLQDGFQIAEKDLELRGSGDILGKVQSGFGDEIENLLGLNPELYYQISDLVDELNFEKLDSDIPRLQNYLQKEAKKVWEE